jgi:hypothetical protein
VVLSQLSSVPEAKAEVGFAIIRNFKSLSRDVQDLVFGLIENDDAVVDVALSIYLNFTELPDKIRNDLLIKMSAKEEAAQYTIDIIVHPMIHSRKIFRK